MFNAIMEENSLEDMPIDLTEEKSGYSELSQIEQIRVVSNLVQALENLKSQCPNSSPFDHIRHFSEQALIYTQHHLRQLIHQ